MRTVKKANKISILIPQRHVDDMGLNNTTFDKHEMMGNGFQRSKSRFFRSTIKNYRDESTQSVSVRIAAAGIQWKFVILILLPVPVGYDRYPIHR
jgi:hypothetical protein